MIKKFDEFLENVKSGNLYKYGCVMIYPKVENWKEITSVINIDDVYKPSDPTYGIEKNPHITLLYGLHSDVTKEDVENVLTKFKGRDIDISINGIGKFDDDDKFSVVKLNVDSPLLHKINKELKKLPHTNDYPDYQPHMTIAFVKPDSADKYLSNDYRKKFTNIDKVVYSMTNGEKVRYSL